MGKLFSNSVPLISPTRRKKVQYHLLAIECGTIWKPWGSFFIFMKLKTQVLSTLLTCVADHELKTSILS